MIFRYEALDNQGAKTTGLVEADNSQEADSLLKDNGLTLVSLEVANIKKGINLSFFKMKYYAIEKFLGISTPPPAIFTAAL